MAGLCYSTCHETGGNQPIVRAQQTFETRSNMRPTPVTMPQLEASKMEAEQKHVSHILSGVLTKPSDSLWSPTVVLIMKNGDIPFATDSGQLQCNVCTVK